VSSQDLYVRHEVVIYTTSATTAGSYDRTLGREDGAERQMTLLARALAARGRRVAHIVYAPRHPVELPEGLTLVHRAGYAGGRRVVGGVLEALRIWRALRAADARITIVRGASPALGVASAFCRLHRRALIFSSSNNSDFTLERMSSRVHRALYRIGLRLADAVVVQSNDQALLAQQRFRSLRRVAQIPSFAEVPPSSTNTHRPDSFLWFSRVAPYKRPMRYVDLARALPEAHFVMIPVPDDPRFPELGAVRAAAPEVPNLELHDPVPHEQLSRLIARAAAVVNTSAYEGMPNAFLEAWARGVPVLTLEFDPDAVVARNGLGISAGGSWDRFVEGARELWERRLQREDLANRVRTYVGTAHSMNAVGSRWSELIGELRPFENSARPLDSTPTGGRIADRK
jgi:glycosyltransferase involved in cell wall biosynthesis